MAWGECPNVECSDSQMKAIPIRLLPISTFPFETEKRPIRLFIPDGSLDGNDECPD